MSNDLISRSALHKKILHLYEVDKKATGANAYDLCGMLIEDAPTVDAVEVVRCKDCANFWEYTEERKATVENADGDCSIRKWRSEDEQFCAVTKDDYCSLARRK